MLNIRPYKVLVLPYSLVNFYPSIGGGLLKREKHTHTYINTPHLGELLRGGRMPRARRRSTYTRAAATAHPFPATALLLLLLLLGNARAGFPRRPLRAALHDQLGGATSHQPRTPGKRNARDSLGKPYRNRGGGKGREDRRATTLAKNLTKRAMSKHNFIHPSKSAHTPYSQQHARSRYHGDPIYITP